MASKSKGGSTKSNKVDHAAAKGSTKSNKVDHAAAKGSTKNNKVDHAAAKGSTMIRDTVALFIITLIAGCLLGLVNDVTKDLIAAANLQKKMDAYRTVFAVAEDFRENEEISAKAADVEGFSKIIDEANATGSYEKTGVDAKIESVKINEVLEAVDSSGNVLGYVVSFTGSAGYGGDIEMSLGVDTAGVITGFEVISNSETAGLGANCTNAEFKDQFKGISTSGILYTKSGKKEGSDPAEIDALSGATVTTKAVTKSVNGVLLFVHTYCIDTQSME